jgi:hypothetical protein
LNIFKIIIRSHTFRRVIYISVLFAVILYVSNLFFDKSWNDKCMKPLADIETAYKIPDEYYNLPAVNLKLLNSGMLGIEANQKFEILGSGHDYGYLDSVHVTGPDSAFSFNNRIYMRFEYRDFNDSIFYVVSHSTNEGIFWNQVFYSSVRIKHLNRFSYNPYNFRINPGKLVPQDILNDNDTLVKQAINYFNNNAPSLGLATCGTNCRILKSICEKFSLPCNIIMLQGGDSYELGYDVKTGYPAHVVCEIYSSKFKKWFVMDPSYGTVFLENRVPLNAVEISNRVYFNRDSSITQDSVLVTRSVLGKDYFNYYRNVYFKSPVIPNIFVRQVIKYFYKNYYYLQLHYSEKIPHKRNGSQYIEEKTIMYLLIAFLYIIVVFLVMTGRLYILKLKTNSINHNNNKR